jgi:hypothetical protein
MERPPRVHLEGDWFPQLTTALIRAGTAELVIAATESLRMGEAIVRVASEPIDAETLMVHARLIGVARDADQLLATFELPEAAQ